MRYDAYLGIKFEAFAAGMSAKSGGLDPGAVARMIATAEQHLEPESRLRRAVEGFAMDARIYARDPNQLARIGGDLCSFIDVLNVPEAIDQNRSDIYG